MNFFQEALKQEPQKMLGALVKEIILYDDKIEITYNYTNRKDPDYKNQGFLIYEGSLDFSTFINQYECLRKTLKFSLFV